MALSAVGKAQLQLFGDDRCLQTPVAVLHDYEPSPLARHTFPVPPLVNPERQLTYGAVSPEEWPPLKREHNAIAVERTWTDIDGPPHRFLIREGDTVEVVFSQDRVELAQVVEVSQPRREVSVQLPSSHEKIWVDAERLYPAQRLHRERHRGKA